MEKLPNEHIPLNKKEKKSSERWEARKPFILEKDFFELQMEFAKEIQHKTHEPLLNIIKERTSDLRLNAFNREGYKMTGLKPGVTEENIVDMSYQEYLRTSDEDLIEYHPEGSTRFGCFYYDQDEKKEKIRVHFFNAEFDSVGPLDKTKIELRKKEMKDMLNDIKIKYKDVQEISGLSWLYNLPSYKRLFPANYLKNLEINEDPFQWARGTTIWGQFIDNQYHLKKDLADELIKRLKELSPDQPLSEVFKKGPPLLSPLNSHAPLQDFYTMYGIE